MFEPVPGLLALALNDVGRFAFGPEVVTCKSATGVAVSPVGPTVTVFACDGLLFVPASSVVVSWIG